MNSMNSSIIEVNKESLNENTHYLENMSYGIVADEGQYNRNPIKNDAKK